MLNQIRFKAHIELSYVSNDVPVLTDCICKYTRFNLSSSNIIVRFKFESSRATISSSRVSNVSFAYFKFKSIVSR